MASARRRVVYCAAAGSARRPEGVARTGAVAVAVERLGGVAAWILAADELRDGFWTNLRDGF